jgi:hypothetical protein
MATFDANVCRKIGYDELVVYSAGTIAESGHEMTFEGLVAQSFECFPERFLLRG